MTFEAFLVDKGLVAEEDMNEALDKKRQSRMPIGKMAVAAGKLTVKHIFKILNIQSADNEKRRFGEIAVDLGFMTEKDIEKLLEKQRASSKSTVEILVEMEFLTKSIANRETKAYEDAAKGQAVGWKIF